MSNSLKHIIQEFADELKTFNRNDVLVSFSDNDTFEIPAEIRAICLPAEGYLMKTFKKTQDLFRESGTSVFCLSKGMLQWEWNDIPCETPILLCPATIKLDKVKKQFDISWENEEAFLNPFLRFYFQKQFDYKWPAIDASNPDWQTIEALLVERGFKLEISDKNHFGNFHHHRFAVLRELEGLVDGDHYSSVLKSVFGEVTEDKEPVFKRESRHLFPADNDQLQVFEQLIKSNLVVHGPPGTGKSQVLANVLGKNLSQNLKTLVVSEKRVALEVLKQKMETFGLQRFVFLQGPNSNAQSLLEQLKESWQFLESYNSTQTPFLPVAKLKLDGLQFKMNVLSKDDLIGGVSFLTFKELRKGKKLKKVNYYSGATSIAELQLHKEQIQEIFALQLEKICGLISKKHVEREEIFQFDEKLNHIEKTWNTLQKHFPFGTKNELEALMKKAAFAQIVDNEKHKDYFPILQPDSKDLKKFARWSKKYFVLKKELDNAKKKNDHWGKKLSRSETETLLKEIKIPGFFHKRKIKKYLGAHLKSSYVHEEEALKDNLVMHQKKEEFRIIEKKLTELGIKEETEIFWIKDLSAKMTQENWAVWSATDAQTNRDLANANTQLNQLYQNVKSYLQLSGDAPVLEIFQLFKTYFSSFLAHRKIVLSFDSALYKHIGKCETFEQLENETLKSNWVRFVEHFPAFTNFKLNHIGEILEDVMLLEKKESEDFAGKIMDQQKKKFESFHTLLRTPSRKLTEEEKKKKASLRHGRSLLIKEFGKTRSHPTIRELLESDAKDWMYTLLPIWMLNPSQVGDFFPLERQLFDMVLFDESTQIPLRNALGSLQRAKRALVLGDEHQMSPTHFFKSGDSEPIDLLHQARFNWPKLMLKHHYRSQHPELIQFSNRHFYDNQLIAYPKAERTEKAIEIHYLADGAFLENENEKEAKALAKLFVKQLKKEGSLGLVAFSESQLKCILRQLSNEERLLLEDKIETNQAFVRTLENVQGDECDFLFISLGYGKNEEGKVSLNFGPLNRKSGRRRLNVLLSRAKIKIHFFTSIQAKDLSLSDNDSLNLLRQFLMQQEDSSIQSDYVFPLGLTVHSITKEGSSSCVQFDNLLGHIQEANELLTFYRVLTERGWKIQF